MHVYTQLEELLPLEQEVQRKTRQLQQENESPLICVHMLMIYMLTLCLLALCLCL